MKEQIRKLFNKKEADAALLYLYAIENNINPYLIEIDQETISALYAKKFIIRDSQGKLAVINEVASQDWFESWISDWRAKFKLAPKGNIGNKAKTIDNMKWFIRETGATYELIDRATDSYISFCIRNNRYSREPQYFIHKSDTKRAKSLANSDLYEWVQRTQEEGQKDKFSTLV